MGYVSGKEVKFREKRSNFIRCGVYMCVIYMRECALLYVCVLACVCVSLMCELQSVFLHIAVYSFV